MTIYTAAPWVEIPRIYLTQNRLLLLRDVRAWFLRAAPKVPSHGWRCTPHIDYLRPAIVAPGHFLGRPLTFLRLLDQVWVRVACPSSEDDRFDSLAELDLV